jgi:hypothetical protein
MLLPAWYDLEEGAPPIVLRGCPALHAGQALWYCNRCCGDLFTVWGLQGVGCVNG